MHAVYEACTPSVTHAPPRTHRRVPWPNNVCAGPASVLLQPCGAASKRTGSGSQTPQQAQPRPSDSMRARPQPMSQAPSDADSGYLRPPIAANPWGGYGRYSGVGLSLEPDPQLVNAMDKNRLKPELRAELARRLRREAPESEVPPGQRHVLRVFRFALDDLRLYKAIHQAGLEGRVVVVDDPDRAHAVLAVEFSRTGRHVVVDKARNLAANKGIPYIQLQRVSGPRLLEAVGPLMNIPVERQQPARTHPVLVEEDQFKAQGEAVLQRLQLGPSPVTMKPGSPAGTESNTVLGTMGFGSPLVAPAVGTRGFSGQLQPGLKAGLTIGDLLLGGGGSDTAEDSPQQQGRGQVEHTEVSPPGGPQADFSADGAGMSGTPTQGLTVQSWVEVTPDSVLLGAVEDDRGRLLPANPTARIGTKHTVTRPIKHGRKQKAKVQLRKAAEKDAPW